MSYLKLCDIGKIYAGDSGIAVGIRGVNLSFDKGEFVAITGQSGSGKSTLLNIISGMDTYEEGEMYIEGEPTSHYIQSDYEEYRKKYISFIFQDYNIIESFTVLQNVELALMHIDEPKQRRKKALELIERVGMSAHIKHRGSQLSGGQKQRTVIARALAKDSPIILADEPTGNLDSKTSEEIIQLLHDVSKDKLLIVVTHDFEEVEKFATRHIRIFDGGVEFDHVLKEHETPVEEETKKTDSYRVVKRKRTKKEKIAFIKNSAMLGRVRFFSMPKLSLFICTLMTLTSIALTFATSVFAEGESLFDKNYLFEHENGRLIIMRSDKTVMTDDEIRGIAERFGASSYLKDDFLCDFKYLYDNGNDNYTYFDGFSKEYYKKADLGRYPEEDNEALLYIPICMKEDYNESSLNSKINLSIQRSGSGSMIYDIVGIKYFYDNTKESAVVLSEDGYETANALAFFYKCLSPTGELTLESDKGRAVYSDISSVVASFDVKEDEFCYFSSSKEKSIKAFISDSKEKVTQTVTLRGQYSKSNYGEGSYGVFDGYYGGEVTVIEPYETNIDNLKINTDTTGVYNEIRELLKSNYFGGYYSDNCLLMNPKVIREFVEKEYFETKYYQSSIFLKNDKAAEDAAVALREEGYRAAPSNTVIKPQAFDYVISIIAPLSAAISWVVIAAFIGILLSLCTSRAMQATSGDIAILRTMGIPVSVIKASIYVQTLIALIPAFIATALFAFTIFVIPSTNGNFTFLHAGEYTLIAVALIIAVIVLSRRYVKRIFGSTVKKTLKGGGIK